MKRWLQEKIARLSELLRSQETARTLRALERRGLLSLGRHTYGMPRIHSYAGSEARISIGSFCSVAPDVQIINGGIHPKSWVSLFPFRIMWNLEGAHEDGMPETRGEIVIGSDVWLGTGAMIMSGVRIGHGAIVAARAVVTHDVEPYAIVAGCPAKRQAFRFPPEVVKQLLEICWWEWDDARIREAVPLLSSPNIDRFLQKYHLPLEV
jgi:acetyltransferase-like isoleucine patch superfamily enzyme